MSKLKVMYEGILELTNCKIPCYVLEDGTRVLSGRQMQTALKLTGDMPSSQSAGSRLIVKETPLGCLFILPI